MSNPRLCPSFAFRVTTVALFVAMIAIVPPVGADSVTPDADAGPAAAAIDPDANVTPDPHVRVRGMTISCPGAGRVWGSDAMVETMAKLEAMGVNWVAIHPYAGISPDGTVGGSRLDRMYEDTTWITRPIAEAHRLGLKIMIKPHIAYWGSPFSWRGEITFSTDEQWERFFTTYERWINRVAEISAGADAFVVGTELDRTVDREASWRRIIAGVRSRIDTPLSYAANWDQFETVPFWDALDVIGVQGYFPLVDHERVPTQAELDASWQRLVGRLETFGKRFDRRVVLAELGYNRTAEAAVRPWEYRQGGEAAELVQRRCLTAALAALEDSDGVVGAFLWKWFPGERNRGNFLKSTPAMQRVIQRAWTPTATGPRRTGMRSGPAPGSGTVSSP
ncbi:MAG: hypothetical protein HKO59_08045 [Phycisphaerales bacterium]|nr:hypothetical protein [Phycisphaerae bacterium]NNF41675.1 hypothetical protein [Phycisphaerales bacterium]NNM25923.1 hypothetical protein [Phycisphaerales bacterium]